MGRQLGECKTSKPVIYIFFLLRKRKKLIIPLMLFQAKSVLAKTNQQGNVRETKNTSSSLTARRGWGGGQRRGGMQLKRLSVHSVWSWLQDVRLPNRHAGHSHSMKVCSRYPVFKYDSAPFRWEVIVQSHRQRPQLRVVLMEAMHIMPAKGTSKGSKNITVMLRAGGLLVWKQKAEQNWSPFKENCLKHKIMHKVQLQYVYTEHIHMR